MLPYFLYSRFQYKLSTIGLATLTTLTFPAFADEVEQNTLTIYGSTYRNTASKSALDPEETPQGITVIDRKSLDQRAANSINEAVRYTSGVNTELRGGAVTRIDQFNIRGFNNYQNYYDGLPLIYNDWNLQPQIDAATVKQIEVFKGPTSVLYGSMPPGGMVNIIAKQPTKTKANSVEVSSGNFNLKKAVINSAGTLANREDLTYSVTALVKKKDGQAVTSTEERHVIAPSVNWQLSPDTLINFNLYYQKDPSAGIYNTHPSEGTVFSNPNGQLDSDSYAGDANWNVYDRDVTMFGYKVNHRFNDNWTFLHNARFMDADALQKNTYSTALAADKKTLGRRAYLTDESSKSFTLDNQLSGRIESGGIEHNILIGADFQKLNSSIKYEDVAAPSINLFSPNHYQIDKNLDISNSSLTSDFKLTKKQVGLYLQDQLIIDNWVLIAGARYDNFKSTEKGKKYNATVDTTLSQKQFSGRLGALYNFDNGIAPFASYAQSFEPISGSDKAGNVFVPATADQFEIGLKYNPIDSDTAMTISAFRITKNNVITRDPNGSPYDKIQAGEIRSQGVELSLNKALTDNLSLDFNATILDMEFTEDTDLAGKTPVWVPERTASLWANYQIPNTILQNSELGLGVRYVGETQLDAKNTGTVPAYTVLDLAFNMDLANVAPKLQGASLNLSVNNLLNKGYNSCYDANNCWFGAERSIEAKFKYAF